MKFKTPRIENEYYNLLPNKNKKLYTILMLLDNFTQVEFQKEITITDMFRTQDELKALYANTPNPPTTSPHCFWNAADIRSSDWDEKQSQRMLTFLNCFSYKSGAGRPVSFRHDIGNGFHFHLQAN